MRALFLFLLLANVAFFAWSRYYSPADAGADPLPLTRQIEPDVQVYPHGHNFLRDTRMAQHNWLTVTRL